MRKVLVFIVLIMALVTYGCSLQNENTAACVNEPIIERPQWFEATIYDYQATETYNYAWVKLLFDVDKITANAPQNMVDNTKVNYQIKNGYEVLFSGEITDNFAHPVKVPIKQGLSYYMTISVYGSTVYEETNLIDIKGEKQ